VLVNLKTIFFCTWPRTCDYVTWLCKRIKVAHGNKVVSELFLRWKDYPGLSLGPVERQRFLDGEEGVGDGKSEQHSMGSPVLHCCLKMEERATGKKYRGC
jgi:hypothetical protein